jgi:hypothetical protein
MRDRERLAKALLGELIEHPLFDDQVRRAFVLAQ